MDVWTASLSASARAIRSLPPTTPWLAKSPKPAAASASVGGVLVLELVARGDGEPGRDRCPRPGGRNEPLERLGDRAAARLAQRRLRGHELLAGHGRPVARLAVAVQRPLLVQLEAEPRRRRAQNVVAGQDELRPELDDGAVLEAARADASAQPVSRLEHRHLGAAGRERLRRREAGEAGADDDDLTVGQVPRGSAG